MGLKQIALSSVSVVNANGSSVQEPVAVAVGTGTFNGTPQVPVLVVVDMTDPRHPVAQGFVELIDNSGALVYPTDVILKDTIAVIGTGKGEVLLVDISDPAFPLFAGEIDGSFGTHLALTDDNILVTSSVCSGYGRRAAHQIASVRITAVRYFPSEIGHTLGK